MKGQGFRRIDNDIFRALMRADLTRAEYKVVLAVIDETLGFQRREAEISLSIFTQKTGVSRPAVIQAIKSLMALNVIDMILPGTRQKTANVYVLNVPEVWTGKAHFTSDDNSLVKPLVTSTLPVERQNFTSTGKVVVPASPPIKETIKETIKEKKENVTSSFNEVSRGTGEPGIKRDTPGFDLYGHPLWPIPSRPNGGINTKMREILDANGYGEEEISALTPEKAEEIIKGIYIKSFRGST